MYKRIVTTMIASGIEACAKTFKLENNVYSAIIDGLVEVVSLSEEMKIFDEDGMPAIESIEYQNLAIEGYAKFGINLIEIVAGISENTYAKLQLAYDTIREQVYEALDFKNSIVINKMVEILDYIEDEMIFERFLEILN